VEYADISDPSTQLAEGNAGYINLTQQVVNPLRSSRAGYRSLVYIQVEVSQIRAGKRIKASPTAHQPAALNPPSPQGWRQSAHVLALCPPAGWCVCASR